jgi:MscS family membrane protein
MFSAIELSNQRAGRTADSLGVRVLSGWGQLLCGFLLTVGFLFCSSAVAQQTAPAVPSVPQPELPRDTLGRTTPRGTVLGFLNAERKDNDEFAAQYLNTRLRGKPASNLAHQLFVVLDRRLPAKLDELSDKPEGSLTDLLEPNMDRVGSIASSNGNVEILLERVDLGKAGSCWLFSGKTLESIPELYKEVNGASADNTLTEFLLNTRLARISIFEWLAILLGLPFLYLLALMLNRLLSRLAGQLRRYSLKKADLPDPEVLPAQVRLLLIAFTILWAISKVGLPLFARQLWSTLATILIIVSCVWLFIRLNSWAEERICQRLLLRKSTGAVSIARLVQRVIDVLAVFVGVLVGLKHFGLSPTGALAGLGVGGIAVALAAQKTLENVVGGVSVIFDQTVRVGDNLKVGETRGTVENIGLRSTRIRTLDQTIVSVPNGQMANASLENLSLRDKFWFHPNLRLSYDTSPVQLHSVLRSLTEMLEKYPVVERNSIRVSFLSFGTAALELEVFAYLFARDWSNFLDIQGELQIQIMEIVEAAGTRMAHPASPQVQGPTPDGAKTVGVTRKPN